MNQRIVELRKLILNKLCRPKDYNTTKQRWLRGEFDYSKGDRTKEELEKLRRRAAEKEENWKPRKGAPDWPVLLDELISLICEENKEGK